MALMTDDHVRCTECGCTSFEEKVVVVFNREASKVFFASLENPIPGNFIESKRVEYVCTKCGSKIR